MENKRKSKEASLERKRKLKEASLETQRKKMKMKNHMQLMKKPLTMQEANNLEDIIREICDKKDNSMIELFC